MNTFKDLFSRTWRPVVVVLGLALLAYFLYFHRLGTLPPGFSAPETNTVLNASSWHKLAENPVNIIYNGPVWLLTAVLHHGFIATRIVSASLGLVAVVFFFGIIRELFSFRIACLGTLLFATSAGFLHIARLGLPYILQMGVLVYIGAIVWYRHSERKTPLGYLVVLLCALLCYIPGLIWYEIFGFLLLAGGIRWRISQTSAVHVAGYSLVFLAVLAPLILAAARHNNVLLDATALPADFHELNHFVSNFLHGLLAIGIRSTGNPLLWVGHAPLLNIVELVLAAMGAYYYVLRERSMRTTFMLGSIIISLVLIGFGMLAGYAVLVPLLYIFVASGLNQLLDQWLTVFPRNPFAKFVGIGLLCAMLFFSVFYQVRSYFVAWPHSANTEHTFSIRQPS